MAEREVKISFTGDAALFKGAGADVRRVFNDLMADADDASLAGDKLAKAYQIANEKMRADMADVQRAADVLADSLGPEMVAAIEQSGGAVSDWVRKFQKAGLAIDDIIVSSDQLAAAIKDTDDAASGGTGKVGAGFANIRREVDQTRSVVANFVGNAVQELPGIAGAMGPMNMALGQFAEYATEGNIQLAKFAPAIAGMAVAGAALQALPQILGDIGGAKQEAFDAKQVELFRGAVDKVPAALDDVTVAAQALADKLKDNPWDLMVSQIDGALQLPLVPFFAEAGLTMDQFLAAVTGGEQGISRLKEALQAAGVEGMTYETIVAGAEQAQGNWNTTAKLAETLNRVLGTSTRDLADETRVATTATNEQAAKVAEGARIREEAAAREQQANQDLIDSYKEYYQSRIDGEKAADGRKRAAEVAEYTKSRIAAVNDEIEAQDRLRRAREEANRAAEELFSAERARFDVQGRLTRAMNESAGAVKAYGDAANSGTAGTLELIALSQAVADAAMSQADGVLAAAENTAKLNGQTLDAGQKTSIFKQALLDFANSLPDLSPLKGQILDLASGFTDIPSDKTITVSAPGAKDAAIDLTDVRTQQDKILPTTSISTEVRNQALTWGLLEAVRLKGVEVDQLAPTVSVSVQGYATAISQLREIAAAAAAAQSAAARAASASVASAQSAQAKINQLRAGAII